VVLKGEYDPASRDFLRDTLSSLLETHPVVVTDLSRVLFLGSSVLGELVRADRAARGGGKHFRLQLGTDPIVARVLEIRAGRNVRR
jgi:anti-anti-sigma factor